MSDSPTFQDTPLYAWLRENRWYLLAGVVLVFGISFYRQSAPKWRVEDERDSWDRFQSLLAPTPGQADLPTRLAQAEQDDRIHAWFVFNSVRQAAAEGDQAALELLRPQLQALEATDQVMVATSGGPQKMSSYLLSQIKEGAEPLPREFPIPEPAGTSIEIVLTVNDTTTYTVVYGLYEDLTPQGCASFLAWIEAGRFQDQDARKMGLSGITLNLKAVEVAEGAEAPAPLMVERPYGLFHAAGVLALMQLPGKGGEQDQNAVQLLLSDAFYQDGYSTVVGKATQGWPEFLAAMSALENTAKIRVQSVRRL